MSSRIECGKGRFPAIPQDVAFLFFLFFLLLACPQALIDLNLPIIMSGQAASYYNFNQGFEGQDQNHQNYQNTQQSYYQPFQEPKAPSYAQNAPLPQQSGYHFEDAFKIERPKYNDLWAGLLVSDPPRWSESTSKIDAGKVVNRCFPGIRCSIWAHHPFVCKVQRV